MVPKRLTSCTDPQRPLKAKVFTTSGRALLCATWHAVHAHLAPATVSLTTPVATRQSILWLRGTCEVSPGSVLPVA